jgi:hypothetical protein
MRERNPSHPILIGPDSSYSGYLRVDKYPVDRKRIDRDSRAVHTAGAFLDNSLERFWRLRSGDQPTYNGLQFGLVGHWHPGFVWQSVAVLVVSINGGAPISIYTPRRSC